MELIQRGSGVFVDRDFFGADARVNSSPTRHSPDLVPKLLLLFRVAGDLIWSWCAEGPGGSARLEILGQLGLDDEEASNFDDEEASTR